MTDVKIFYKRSYESEENFFTWDTFVTYNPACKFTFVTFDTIVYQIHVRVKREQSHS